LFRQCRRTLLGHAKRKTRVKMTTAPCEQIQSDQGEFGETRDPLFY
jgi:hypothetical protein